MNHCHSSSGLRWEQGTTGCEQGERHDLCTISQPHFLTLFLFRETSQQFTMAGRLKGGHPFSSPPAVWVLVSALTGSWEPPSSLILALFLGTRPLPPLSQNFDKLISAPLPCPVAHLQPLSTLFLGTLKSEGVVYKAHTHLGRSGCWGGRSSDILHPRELTFPAALLWSSLLL